jgi:RHS repeat-associated protein
VQTTLPAGTDNQVFCYDDLNRLTWAGSTGTPSCGTSLTPGSLTSAAYTASYAYDTNNRLTTGPAGTYTYGNSSHVDALTSASSGYTASYDAAGDMTCRAPSSSLTCSGTATGQSMTYDHLRRLLHWQNQTSSPTTWEGYVYDGEGQRVERAVTTGGTTTVTYTIGSYEDVTTVNGTTTITKYYGKSAVNANGTLSYLLDDGLGSVSESLSTSGSVTGAQLFAPYGSVRYSTGSFPGPQAFTGQRQDGSGLAYFNARYYDPAAGQFTSADSVQGPNRYGYVAGNPETATDPTGLFGMCGGAAMADGVCWRTIQHQGESSSGTTAITNVTWHHGTHMGKGHRPALNSDCINPTPVWPCSTPPSSSSSSQRTFTLCAVEDTSACRVAFGGIPGVHVGGLISKYQSSVNPQGAAGSDALLAQGSIGLKDLILALGSLQSTVDTIIKNELAFLNQSIANLQLDLASGGVAGAVGIFIAGVYFGSQISALQQDVHDLTTVMNNIDDNFYQVISQLETDLNGSISDTQLFGVVEEPQTNNPSNDYILGTGYNNITIGSFALTYGNLVVCTTDCSTAI